MDSSAENGARVAPAHADDVSAADRAYEYIRNAIIEGRLQTGEMLSEGSLGVELKLSRTPIRAALLRLQDEQWITIYPKRGALVRGMTERMVTDLVDARFVVEASSIHRVSTARRPALIERLEQLNAAQQQAWTRGDLRDFINLTVLFHHSFVEASGNSVLVEMSERLADRQRYMLFHLGDQLFSRGDRILAEQRALIQALQAGDNDQFTKALNFHLKEAMFGDDSEYDLPFERTAPRFDPQRRQELRNL